MPERKVFEPNEAVFIHEEMDSYNWNYLDQHICGDQEFNELMEVNSLQMLLTERAETFTLICNSFQGVTVRLFCFKSFGSRIEGAVTRLSGSFCFSDFRVTLKWKRANETETTNENRAIWLVYWTNTNARGFWLVKRTLGWEHFMPENFLEIHRYFALTSYCNTIDQSNNAFAISYSYLTGKLRGHVLIFSSIGW